MPVITVDWWQGNDRERRSHLVSELAAATSRVTGCAPDEVTVIVRDCEPGAVPHGGASEGRPGTADPGEVGLGHGSPW
ncbi:tautomerase family protein [Streptomyces spiramenti]|uniref:4-oxalocrotonate tautomerase family enzyme n=1 Tax=Streptomyces spiramenti TaxID=2720606 RepID=A0ABX1ASK3_9ACTN|nr:tautomerase family protein [Streptomyces spiramenti]NJP67205.1 4-oxalocrotonate tautomerase family enzyme [Streptomyces spiramenti]